MRPTTAASQKKCNRILTTPWLRLAISPFVLATCASPIRTHKPEVLQYNDSNFLKMRSTLLIRCSDKNSESGWRQPYNVYTDTNIHFLETTTINSKAVERDCGSFENYPLKEIRLIVELENSGQNTPPSSEFRPDPRFTCEEAMEQISKKTRSPLCYCVKSEGPIRGQPSHRAKSFNTQRQQGAFMVHDKIVFVNTITRLDYYSFWVICGRTED